MGRMKSLRLNGCSSLFDLATLRLLTFSLHSPLTSHRSLLFFTPSPPRPFVLPTAPPSQSHELFACDLIINSLALRLLPYSCYG